MENGIQEFNLEERLEQFRRLFIDTTPEYNIGCMQQKQGYRNHKRETGMEDNGVRGINSFGIKLIRRPVYIIEGKESYDGYGHPHHYESNLVLAPKMEVDSSVVLEMSKHYNPIPIPTPHPWDEQKQKDEIMERVREIFLMTNEDVKKQFNVGYPFSDEMLERFRNEDDQIIHSHAVRDLKDSLSERLRLEQQTRPGYEEPFVGE